MNAKRMFRSLRTLSGIALFLSLTGCANWTPLWPPKQTVAVEQSKPQSPPASQAGATQVDEVSMAGSAWMTLYVQDVGPVVDPKPYLQWMQSSRIVGSGGCNRFRGEAHLQGKEQLRFSALAATRMACMPEPGGQEDKFFKALELTRQARLEGEDLILLDQSGKVLAQLRRTDAKTLPSP